MSDLPELILSIDETDGGVSTELTPVPNEPAGRGEPTMDSLSEEDKKKVVEFMQKIDISNADVVIQYGAPAQNKIAKFADSVLQNVRTGDTGEVGKCLGSLVVEIKSFDSGAEDKGKFLGLFGGVKKSVDKMMANYNKVEVNINKIERELEGHKRALLKDIATFGVMYDNNLAYFRELSMYIVAGAERLALYRANDIPAQQRVAEQTGGQMEAQKLNDMISQAERFEKKLHDLKISRTISIQMAPQIRLLQNNNSLLAEKIQSSIVNSIPLWKNQMVLALGISRSKSALEAQSKVTDMTNEMLLKNSETLKQGSIDVARESERSIVSIETVKKTNENLISTINEVLQIQMQGKQARESAETELGKIEDDLKTALLSTKRFN